MATTPPGWYDDGHGALRWWDGAQWTEHVATPDPESEGDEAPTEADIVAANEAQPVPEPAEVDAATALGLGVPPAAGAPAYPGFGAEHPQGEYPGGYAAADASAGAFSAATEPRKSKLWILWVVLGVVMLGIVIAAAIVIPLLFLNLATSGGSAVQPAGSDQEAAVAAVELYDDAWQNVDCDAYFASTSEDFRLTYGYEDCATFEEGASTFAASVQGYELTVTSIEEDGADILVSTTEGGDALLDEDGTPFDEPQPQQWEYVYTVVEVDGGWVIDALDD